MSTKQRKREDIRKTDYPPTDYERIFHPKAIAIIGVSADENGVGFGTGMLRAITAMGFEGKIYPVNPKGGDDFRTEIYKRVEDIPGQSRFCRHRRDGAACAGSPGSLPEKRRGRRGDSLLRLQRTGNTEEGKELEKQIQEIAARGIRVVGPNCFGIYCPASGLTLLPGPDLSRESGPVAFLAQSGGMSIDFAHAGKWLGVRFSKMVSFGNGADLREAELLHYLADDPETQVISMYIEGIKDGDAFFLANSKPPRPKNRSSFTKAAFPRPAPGALPATPRPWAEAASSGSRF